MITILFPTEPIEYSGLTRCSLKTIKCVVYLPYESGEKTVPLQTFFKFAISNREKSNANLRGVNLCQVCAPMRPVLPSVLRSHHQALRKHSRKQLGFRCDCYNGSRGREFLLRPFSRKEILKLLWS
jgi:hypothetical protein